MEDTVKFDITISCCLCSNKYKTEIQLPDGWASRYEATNVDNGFCPEHSIIADWADNQCPGCVGGWGDCDLWRSFAYEGRRNLSEKDFEKIRTGICPKRTNGTFGLSVSTGFTEENLSEKASTESGIALEKAIKHYWKLYP